MQIYLPVAELSVNLPLILLLGLGVGCLSGLFGVGGGFLMTPLLMLLGIPPAVAVGTEANQIVATSISGTLAHWRRKGVDFTMGCVLLAGGLGGSLVGVLLFSFLRQEGEIGLVIRFCYIVFLGAIGTLMLWESLYSLLRLGGGRISTRRSHFWVHKLPFKLRFRASRLYISVLPGLAIGFVVGVLAALMGIGGGFLMVPAMIYLLGMPTRLVAGTSLFQILFVTTSVTFLQAYLNQNVDLVLAALLFVGSAVGAQFGSRLSGRIQAERFRVFLSLLALSVCGKLVFDLTVTPEDVYVLETLHASRPN